MLAPTHPEAGEPDSGFPGLPKDSPIEVDRMKAALAAKLFGADPPESPKIGRYALLKRVGHGGMGVVYSAYDEQLDRKVALKLVREEVLTEEAHSRLEREAKALAKLQHPNVVGVYEVGTHDDRVFLAMEFVEGATLREWLKASPRSADEIVAVFQQAGQGLAAAHAAGLIHRDFKPDNVLIDGSGRVRVLDFGLARPPRGAEGEPPLPPPDDIPLAELTRTGAIMGTPAYMAPEQITDQNADARSDQFSFCVALFEAVYGRRPFAGRSMRELQAAIMKGPSLPPGPKSAPQVRRALERGLRESPADRFPEFKELLAALQPPKARRSWGLLALGAAGVVGLGVAGYMRASPTAAVATCPTAEDAVAELWHDDRKASLQAAVTEASGADVWSAFEDSLDNRLRRWSEAQPTACSEDEMDLALRAAKQRCIEDHLQEIGQTLKVLETAPQRGADARGALWLNSDPVRCTDGRADKMPAFDKGLEARIVQRFDSAHVDSVVLAGGINEGIALGWEQLKTVRATGDQMLIAETAHSLSKALDQTRNFDEIIKVRTEALDAAVAAGDLPRAAILQATIATTQQLGGHWEVGQEWFERAEATARGFGEDQQVEAYLAFARVFFMDPDEKRLREQERVIPLFDGVLDPRSGWHVTNLNNLGVGLRDAGQQKRATQVWEEGLALAESHGENTQLVLFPLYNLSDAYSAQGRHEDSLGAAQRARDLVVRLGMTAASGSENDKRSLRELRNAHLGASRWKEAADVSTELYEVVSLEDDLDGAIYDRTVGTSARFMSGDRERAQREVEEILAEIEGRVPPNDLQTRWDYWQLKNFEGAILVLNEDPKALEVCTKVLEVVEALPAPESQKSWPRAFAAVAIKRMGNDPNEALRLAKLSLAHPGPTDTAMQREVEPIIRAGLYEAFPELKPPDE
jgi:predicted Ser/Thr protein kinase/tetratricopeptide (TPR) repeat protein